MYAVFCNFDIIYQFIFGKRYFWIWFWQLKIERRLSGTFGDEYIAGSYIQRFFYFFFFFFYFFKIKKKKFILFFFFF